MEIIIGCGLIILAIWMLANDLGLSALADSRPRRNNMPAVLPVIFLLIWIVSVGIAAGFLNMLTETIPDNWKVFWEKTTTGLVCLAIAISIVLVINRQFARGIKGLGLGGRKISKDLVFSVVNLFATWPLILVAIYVTTCIGQLIYGVGFEIKPHQELEVLKSYNQPFIQAAIFISGAIITPFFEEVLFRGLFQSLIRSYVIKPWLSIALASTIFTIAHADGTHWPAIFVLGMIMGYAYEKSGSLWRPIFIHALFNGATIIANMN